MRRLPLTALLATCCALALASGCGDEAPRPPSPADAGSLPDGGADGGLPDAGPSDTVAPTVLSTTPAAGASAVASSSTLVVEFSEPMRPGQGLVRLAPGDVELRASAAQWDAAHRTLTLRPAQPLPVSTEVTATVGTDFADVAGNRLTEPFTFRFTVRDDQAPRVLSASPVEGASQVALSTAEVSFTFSEPMDTSVGSLAASGGLTLGTAVWMGNTLTAPLSGLAHGGTYAIELRDFQDAAGNALDTAAYLGDGRLDFSTGADTFAPTVTGSTPAEGTTGVYPVEVYYRTTAPAGLSERKVITIQFSEPMDTSILQATLHDLTDTTAPPRTLSGTWSEAGRTLTLVALQPEEGGPALNENTAYAVDLRGHKDIAGNALDAAHPGLGNGRLDFETGPSDSLLNHACGHTLVGSITAVSAAASPSGTLPRADQTHKHYEVTLPASGATYAGHTRMLLTPETNYVLFLDRSVSVVLHDVAGNAPVDATSETSPPACAGITHLVRFTAPLDPEVRASFSGPAAKFRFILEESF